MALNKSKRTVMSQALLASAIRRFMRTPGFKNDSLQTKKSPSSGSNSGKSQQSQVTSHAISHKTNRFWVSLSNRNNQQNALDSIHARIRESLWFRDLLLSRAIALCGVVAILSLMFVNRQNQLSALAIAGCLGGSLTIFVIVTCYLLYKLHMRSLTESDSKEQLKILQRQNTSPLLPRFQPSVPVLSAEESQDVIRLGPK